MNDSGEKMVNSKKTLLSVFMSFVPFVCAGFVVGLHSYNIATVESNIVIQLVESFFSHGIFTAAVPVFLIISGYLFFRNATTIKIVFQKQKRRIFSLLIPFLAWSLLYFLFYAIGGQFVALNQPVDFSFWGIITGILFYRYVFPMWYMFALIVFSILTPAIYGIFKLPKFVRYLVLAGIGILGILNLDISVTIGDMERTLFAPNYFFYFLLGCILAKEPFLHELVKKLCKLPFFVIIPLFLGAGYVSGMFFDEYWKVFNHRIMIPVVTAAFLILVTKIAMVIQEKGGKVRVIPLIPTMIIYGIHSMVGLLLTKVIGQRLPIMLSYFGIMIFNFALSSLIAVLIKKIKPLSVVFNGNR